MLFLHPRPCGSFPMSSAPRTDCSSRWAFGRNTTHQFLTRTVFCMGSLWAADSLRLHIQLFWCEVFHGLCCCYLFQHGTLSCRGTTCFTRVFHKGCKGFLAQVPGIPPLPPSSPILVDCRVVIFFSLLCYS